MPRKIALAEFVTSAVGARDLPRDGRPEVAMVGRSNVGKSSLINALVRGPIARTSSTPGKTRLVNVYRVVPGAAGRERRLAGAFYLMDLPGYGHTSGGGKAREEFAAIIGAYFDARRRADEASRHAGGAASPLAGCILAIDARHPGLEGDVAALRWIATLDVPIVVVATKADKLSQSERAALVRACETAFGQTPLVVSALTGDGLDELWRRITEWTEVHR